jgi:hypothetical protein
MSDYQRYTATPLRDVLSVAQEILTTRGGLKRTKESAHGLTFAGPEGVVELQAHRHGFQTDVVVRTDQLRTSKIDSVVRFLLNQLPYQPGDPGRG